jgi:1-acyl-sn-glycerol-3-phosphate acyltransferase
MDDWTYKPARDLGMSLAERFRSNKRESGLIGRFGHSAWFAAISAYLKYRQKLIVHGREYLPSAPPFLLISNHASHLDALILASVLPSAVRWCTFPIAAGDTFFETPAHALLAGGLMNALPMWRKNCGRHALEELRARLLDEPCAYILFPEGTRSRTGEIGPFKPGLGMIVAGSSVPIIPCHLHGTFDAWPPTAKRPIAGKTIHLTIGSPLLFDTTPNARDGWQQIAETAHSTVCGLAPTGDNKPPL